MAAEATAAPPVSSLAVSSLPVPGTAGRLGQTACPRRDHLKEDVAAFAAWGASAVLCLLPPDELDRLGVGDLPGIVRQAGLDLFQVPIGDMQVPDAIFEHAWGEVGRRCRGLLRAGGSVLIHCRAGLGRSGLVAARLLVELGVAPEAAIALVRAARPGAIETAAQEAHVRRHVRSRVRSRRAVGPAGFEPAT